MKPLAAVALIEIRRQPETRSFRLAWSDGHVADYPYDYLRGWCPCAMCQGHTALSLVFHPAAGPVEPQSVQPVGNYGLSFAWSDGHSTGIYRFEFLREICPCPECRSAGEPDPLTTN